MTLAEKPRWGLAGLRPLPDTKTVRVKGGMSFRNGMWHSLRNDIIRRNVIYAE